MEQRIYHGKITPADLAQSLLAYFNRGNLRVQQIGGYDPKFAGGTFRATIKIPARIIKQLR